MTDTKFVDRLAVIWARVGDPATELFVDNNPGERAVRVGICGVFSTAVMPLSPNQARELAHELIVRADLIDPKAV